MRIRLGLNTPTESLTIYKPQPSIPKFTLLKNGPIILVGRFSKTPAMYDCITMTADDITNNNAAGPVTQLHGADFVIIQRVNQLSLVSSPVNIQQVYAINYMITLMCQTA
jgi:hypothetical protein